MKLFPLVSLLTIRIFNLSAIHRWKQLRHRPSVVYLYTYFTYIENILLVSFFPFFFSLNFAFCNVTRVTLQESIAFHLKFYYCYTVFIKTFWAKVQKRNCKSLEVQAEMKCGSGTSHLWKSWQNKCGKRNFRSLPVKAERKRGSRTSHIWQ